MEGVDLFKSFFDDNTMSIHIREDHFVRAKVGKPGDWQFKDFSETVMSRNQVEDLAIALIDYAGQDHRSFIEIERNGSTIVQLGKYRIVVTRPPFSDGWEITAVQPIVSLNLVDYDLSEKLKTRIIKQAEGILIAGAPGMGKSTFGKALVEHYSAQGNIVKTIEAPRDLQLANNITQYALNRAEKEEIHDVLLLSRPDYVVFDEMRNTEDFKLFADLRLSGVGLIGIVHATNPIDAVQRFIGRIELGVIPQIIDTVIFIKNGKISKIFDVQIEVKVPNGMTESDLSRPVVTIKDFETKKLEFEVYSYGEETVVVPVVEIEDKSLQLLARGIEKEFERFSEIVSAKMVSRNRCLVSVPEKSIARIIGKKGQNIEKLERELGVNIDIQPIKEEREEIKFGLKFAASTIQFLLDSKFADQNVDIHINNDYYMTARAGKNGVIKVRINNQLGNYLLEALKKKENVCLLKQ